MQPRPSIALLYCKEKAILGHRTSHVLYYRKQQTQPSFMALEESTAISVDEAVWRSRPPCAWGRKLTDGSPVFRTWQASVHLEVGVLTYRSSGRRPPAWQWGKPAAPSRW